MLVLELAQWPVVALAIGLFISALVIAGAGTMLTGRADEIADRTGWGEAAVGAVLLGGATSLPGIVTSVAAAAQNHPSLAISNAIGGIAVQTAFLAVADITYRRANLEHAAASPANLTQGALLVALLAIPLLAMSAPEVSVLGVHPATPLLIGGYLYGINLINAAKVAPMWRPRLTRETQTDETGPKRPERAKRGEKNGARLQLEFAVFAAITAMAGYAVSQFGITLADRTALTETAVGGLFTAVATSLPELVMAVAAVRRGALTLAVSGVIGGNAFDTLFLAFSDIAWRDGSLYHRFNDENVFVVALTILMTGALLLGLLRREKLGFAGIGFESTLIIALYLGSIALLFG